jgi:hypothetical protein
MTYTARGTHHPSQQRRKWRYGYSTGGKSVLFEINGEPLDINPENTKIYIHADAHKQYDHLFVRRDNETFTYIFGVREVIQALMDTEEYTYEWSPEPDPGDVQVYEIYTQAMHPSARPITEAEVKEFRDGLDEDFWGELDS